MKTINDTNLPYTLDEALAQRVLDTVDAGLVEGMGNPTPGAMCIEAAVCFALGLPHSDNPPCVGAAVRSAVIALTDSAWSSDKARASGMRAIAIAQLGSNTLDQLAFATRMAILTVNRIVPVALAQIPDPSDEVKASSALCATAVTLDGARAAARAAAADAWAASHLTG